jgi:hypothetical protein
MRNIAKSDTQLCYVCLSAWNSAAPIEQIFKKFYILEIFENLSES